MLRSLVGGLAWGLLLVASSRAEVIYQQTFPTDTSDLLTTYGFSRVTWDVNGSYTASGGAAVMSGLGVASGRLEHTLAVPYAYDWSNPMTLSANLRNVQTTGNSTYGILNGQRCGGRCLFQKHRWLFVPRTWRGSHRREPDHELAGKSKSADQQHHV